MWWVHIAEVTLIRPPEKRTKKKMRENNKNKGVNTMRWDRTAMHWILLSRSIYSTIAPSNWPTTTKSTTLKGS